jgi:hypothetical protein
MIQLSEKEYLDIIRNATTLKLVPSPGYRYSPDESQIGLTIAPPCNCDIRFQMGKYKLQLPKFQLTEDEKKLPETWKNYVTDATATKDKRFLLSTRPVNQGHCGSCFAVAIATTISDNFLFKYNLDYNPNLSPMYILSCLSDDKSINNQCGGGNPSLVVDLIKENGITTNCAQNYYKICQSQTFCDGKGEDHLNPSDITLEQRNSMIPTCGHCTDDIPKLYTIKTKIISFDVPSIKTHLMKYGAAVGGFLIFSNFMGDISKGKFLKTNGIYIHSVNYTKDSPSDDKPLGGHAISIVGWGSDIITFTDIYGNEYKNVKIDYWICRNSWTENWGDNGYFKYAMYKQFTDSLPAIQTGLAFETDNGSSLGGVILIEPDKYEVEVKAGNPLLNKVDCNVDYTCKNIPLIPPTPVKEIVYVYRMSTLSKWFVGLCFVLVMILLYFYVFGTGKKDKKKKRKSHHK